MEALHSHRTCCMLGGRGASRAPPALQKRPSGLVSTFPSPVELLNRSHVSPACPVTPFHPTAGACALQSAAQLVAQFPQIKCTHCIFCHVPEPVLFCCTIALCQRAFSSAINKLLSKV